MLSIPLRWLSLLVLMLVAFGLRTHELARRPMHADEANQAVKTGELLETGRYAFDPRDHHGPTLYYLAVPLAWLRHERTLAALTEATVRLVPALLGVAGVALLYLLARPLGHWPAFAAAAFLAASPPAVYYSRFFVQETPLLTFTLAAFLLARRWWRTRSLAAAAALGVALGLMQATKSSAPLFLFCALLAVVGARSRSTPDLAAEATGLKPVWPGALAALAAALLTAAIFYSSFFTHPRGVLDAFATYSHAFTRVVGDTGHEKPWWYYLRLFAWERNGGLLWHQLPFSAAALAGAAVAFGRRGSPLLRGAAIYTLLLAIALSLAPYKTPWHAIHLLPGLALLASGACMALARLPTGQFVAAPAALLLAGTLYQQTAHAAFRRPADPRNPYAYVHSSPDVLKVRPLAEAARAWAPHRPIRVIGEEYWPLPWYLRGIEHVGYWATAPADCDGALVIATAAQAEAVRARLRGPYAESILGLRPGVLLVVFTPAE